MDFNYGISFRSLFLGLTQSYVGSCLFKVNKNRSPNNNKSNAIAKEKIEKRVVDQHSHSI